MKKNKKFQRRLKLNKSTIAQLNDRGMDRVAGGSGDTCASICCCDTTDPVVTYRNPCPVPFSEEPTC